MYLHCKSCLIFLEMLKVFGMKIVIFQNNQLALKWILFQLQYSLILCART